jgi:hypothetical protein
VIHLKQRVIFDRVLAVATLKKLLLTRENNMVDAVGWCVRAWIHDKTREHYNLTWVTADHTEPALAMRELTARFALAART